MLPEEASGTSHGAGSTERHFVKHEESNYSFPREFLQILVVLMLLGGPLSALAGGDG